MTSTSRLAAALEAPSPEPDFLSAITTNASLTPAEKLLMIEALFVHDAPAPSPPSQCALGQTAAGPARSSAGDGAHSVGERPLASASRQRTGT